MKRKLTPSEAGKLGAIKIIKIAKERRILLELNYSKNKVKCEICENKLSFKQFKRKNKTCSRKI
jgi:hypothetical protein